ncbi:hypothetical protein GUJ93_ZPchr0003g16930 [Zizania palustris]|uniref:Uncharacterized protein n=1 Tax=Zizania palustris TaxID=103762 RepID=A0A8J5VUX4_ZIZPA|nr:hypothetical protein GUJ93_ZPchr0003g16930 [Zizania palustris]
MMIQQFKRPDGFGVGYTYTKADFESAISRAVEWSKMTPEQRYPKTHSTESFKDSQPKDGVIQEQPKAPPKKRIWVPKPKTLHTSLDSLPGPYHTKDATPNTTKPKNPMPQQYPKKPTYHCSEDELKRVLTMHSSRGRLRNHVEEYCFDIPDVMSDCQRKSMEGRDEDLPTLRRMLLRISSASHLSAIRAQLLWERLGLLLEDDVVIFLCR